MHDVHRSVRTPAAFTARKPSESPAADTFEEHDYISLCPAAARRGVGRLSLSDNPRSRIRARVSSRRAPQRPRSVTRPVDQNDHSFSSCTSSATGHVYEPVSPATSSPARLTRPPVPKSPTRVPCALPPHHRRLSLRRRISTWPAEDVVYQRPVASPSP
ncbi:hypothetical protein OH77DRAFT_1075571 [Trametes cingulata]|nr:hypothetical protein OH77DRAFT_1075571 [Trametes cingulata]